MMAPYFSIRAADRSAERHEMVEAQLVARGIREPRLLAAMRSVRREDFVSDELSEQAYDDRALSVGHQQTISQPYIVAYMSEMLAVGPTHRVLEVGTGTGYQTAILSMLSECVITIERIAELSVSAMARLSPESPMRLTFLVGDGSVGAPQFAPYDRIMMTAAAPSIPSALLDQLADGGRMVLPVGEEGVQRLVLVERRGSRYLETNLIRVRFVPLVGAAGFRG
ncbi:MAG: protein-L-isoaspartate(D-aspartate) O-methyltransferase [Planctomycetota bacterium]